MRDLVESYTHPKPAVTTDLIKQFVNWFGRECIDCLLADREFVGNQWLVFSIKSISDITFDPAII